MKQINLPCVVLQAVLSREPILGSWRAFMARNCPDCQNMAAVSVWMDVGVQCNIIHSANLRARIVLDNHV